MPKEVIDYSNTIIYKIFCRDKNVTDIYVGYTTNFTKRKALHKSCCVSGKDLKIYNIMRCNGGWDNWEMIEIAKYDCKDSTEARIKEQYHYELLNANLNVIYPYANPAKYYCKLCDTQCTGPKEFENHNKSGKHKRLTDNLATNASFSTMLKSSEPESSAIFECEYCNYRTSRKSQYDRHLDTPKHQKREKSTFCQQMSQKINQECLKYVCECGKEYKERTGLWRHKKMCTYNSDLANLNSTNINDISGKDLIMMLIKENKELQSLLVEHAREYKDDIKNMMMEVLKNGTNNMTNNNNTNTNCMNNNKTFNLQFFLNETCKDAMNINDFVDSIKVQLSDLERFGEIGYVENLSNIITTNLKALDVTERPVHCTDKKRETIYIKDENKWEKEDDNKTLLRKAIKKIAAKNYRLLPEYREKYPGCQYADSKYSDTYNKMVVEAMCGNGREDEKEDKIIKNISKNVIIDKTDI